MLSFPSVGLHCQGSSSATNGKTRCGPLVAEILSIQDERNRLMVEMDEVFLAAESGELAEEETLKRIRDWRARESELHSRVDLLYNRAEDAGCL